MVIQKLNSIIGKEITRHELVALENSARKENYFILAHNLRKLLLSDPDEQKFILTNVSEANYIDQQTLEGFELDQDPDISNLGTTKSENIYSEITKMVIELIEKAEDKLIWEKPWNGAKTYGHVMNYITKKSYRGINYFLLELLYPLFYEKLWNNPYFLSKKQIESKKGTLKKGAPGYPIIFYTFGFSYENKEAGIEIIEYTEEKFIARIKKVRNKIPELKNSKMTLSIFAHLNKFASVKRYKVYNGEDIEGIDWKLNEIVIKNDFNPIETAEKILDNMPKRPLIKNGGDQAFYSPEKDFVNMPVQSSFKSDQKYYATLFHELIHSTGHKSRLDRSMEGTFGSIEYAYEELIAELGAAYITAEAGILNHHIKNTAAYIKSWNKRLVEKMIDDKTFIFKASGSAQHAADFILSPNKKGIPKYRANIKIKPAKKEIEKAPKISEKKNRPSVKPEAKKNSGAELKPNKKVSASAISAIQQLLVLPKYKGLSEMAMQMLYSAFKDTDTVEIPETTGLRAKMFQNTLETKYGWVEYDSSNDTYSITDDGRHIVDAIAGRLNTLKAKKGGQDLFPELAGTKPKKPAKKNLGSLPPLFHRPGEKIEKINVFRLSGEIGKALQDLQRYRLVILLTGDTHAGKTQFAWQLVDSFVDSGYRVGVFDLEQGGLQSKDTELSIERNVQAKNRPALAVTGEAPKGIDTIREHANNFDVIMIDSWQKLKLPNTRLDDLRNEFPNTIFIVIFQQNGEGGTRGGVSADFDAPIAIKVHKVDTTFVNNYAEVWKNRGNTAGVKYNLFKKKVLIDKPAEKPEKK